MRLVLQRRCWGDMLNWTPRPKLLQTELVMGTEVNKNRWHVDVIRSLLTKDLPSILPGLLDELPLAVQDNIPGEEGE